MSFARSFGPAPLFAFTFETGQKLIAHSNASFPRHWDTTIYLQSLEVAVLLFETFANDGEEIATRPFHSRYVDIDPAFASVGPHNGPAALAGKHDSGSPSPSGVGFTE